MYSVELYMRVRRACMVDGMSIREASRVFGLHRDTVRKMLKYAAPPGYRRSKPPRRPKIGPYTGVIDRILQDDLNVPKKQRPHRKAHLRAVEGRARVRRRIHHSQGLCERAPQEDEGDVRSAASSAGPRTVRLRRGVGRDSRHEAQGPPLRAGPSPQRRHLREGISRRDHRGVLRRARIGVRLPGRSSPEYPPPSRGQALYDNTKLAVARILRDGRRRRTRVFTELQSYYLFTDRFGRPGKGNNKGNVEGMVGYGRRNFLVPIPSFESFFALNLYLEGRCLERLEATLRGYTETIGERMKQDLAALLPLPAVPYDASDKRMTRVSSPSLVRYKTNDYSVPVEYGHRDVLVRGYVDEVVISCGSEVIARHRRSYERDDFVFDPFHYLPLLEQKTAALDQAAPLVGWELPDEFDTLRRLLESRMGRRGKKEFVQVLRLMETFSADEVHQAVRYVIRLGAIGFDAVKHLMLCNIEGRPTRLDLELYPYLPRVSVGKTSATDYMTLLSRRTS